MTSADWELTGEIFSAAVELSGAQRAEYLDRACAGHEALRAQVDELLACDAEAHAAIAAAVHEGHEALDDEERHDAAGRRFGPYRVTGTIGHGGMGAVYRAVRDDNAYRKDVAIKVMRVGMESPHALERFRQERQILAALDHPGIARLLDGGETDDREPYIVMEFVEGQDLLAYAAARRLTQRARLSLFLKVCEAVQFAHRNLIVHRDLKPGNILVDASGQPKLLDFGIAKLLDPEATVTQTGLSGLTPAYASPEQILGQPISTASDVYSLGVILYELLTSRRPYEVGGASPYDIHKAICLEEPAAPKLGSDLDTILLAALRKETARRFGSAQELADDIDRFLNNLPVRSRPDTVVYRTRKYARRHWVALLAAAVTFAAVCAGAAVSAYQARIAQQRFDQVRKLARSFVFDFDADLARVAGNTAVREKMTRTALEYLDMLSQSSAADPGLESELAAAYRKVGDTQGNPALANLGHVDQALASYAKARTLYDRVATSGPEYLPAVTDFYDAYTSLLTNTGQNEKAAATGAQALASAQRLAQARPTEEAAQIRLVKTFGLLGDIDDNRGNYASALATFRKAESVTESILVRGRSMAGLRAAEETQGRIGVEAAQLGFLNAAAAAMAKDQALLNQLTAADPQDSKVTRVQKFLYDAEADLYLHDLIPNWEDPQKCLEFARQSLATARRGAEADPNDAAAQFTLAVALYRSSLPLGYTDPPSAVRAAQQALEILDRQIAAGKTSFLVASRRLRAQHRLAEALVSAGRPADARAMAAPALAAEREAAAKEDPDLKTTPRLVLSLLTSAGAELAARDLRAAQTYLDEAEEMATRLLRRRPDQMAAAIALMRVREAQAKAWRLAGDAVRARMAADQAAKVWDAFPAGNEYVAVERARLAAAR